MNLEDVAKKMGTLAEKNDIECIMRLEGEEDVNITIVNGKTVPNVMASLDDLVREIVNTCSEQAKMNRLDLLSIFLEGVVQHVKKEGE